MCRPAQRRGIQRRPKQNILIFSYKIVKVTTDRTQTRDNVLLSYYTEKHFTVRNMRRTQHKVGIWDY